MWLRISARYKFAYSGTTDAVITSVPGSMSKTLGAELFRAYLVSLSKFRKDPRVDRKKLRDIATNLVLGMAGVREFHAKSAAWAMMTGMRIYPDPLLAPRSARILARVAASRTRDRIRRTRSRSR